MNVSALRCFPVLLIACLPPLAASAEERYVGRFDFYGGFTYFESPLINLAERGYHLQFAYNPKTWYAIGFDYSNVNGTLNLIPAYLPSTLQQTIEPYLALLGPNAHPSVPTSTNTQTFALGPAITIRHFKHFGMFVHPSLGALREVATPHANDPLIAFALPLFFPGKYKLDWTGFYGAGGGIDVRVMKHLSFRMQTDVVWDHVIDDILGKGHWTIRASLGPSFHFGRNIAH